MKVRQYTIKRIENNGLTSFNTTWLPDTKLKIGQKVRLRGSDFWYTVVDAFDKICDDTDLGNDWNNNMIIDEHPCSDALSKDGG